MKTPREYLEAALLKLGDISDRKKAEALCIKASALSHYRTEIRLMDDYTCTQIATLLGFDPMEVIAACQLQREKDEERKAFWGVLQERLIDERESRAAERPD